MSRLRGEVRPSIEKLETSVCVKIKDVILKNDTLTGQAQTVRGGIIVLAAIGGIIVWLTGLASNLSKLWSH